MAQLARMMDGERHCCRFLRFTLGVQPNLGEVTLDVTGPDGAREFLESWLAAGGGAADVRA